MDFAIKTVQLLLSLSILVIIHECGHFFFARLFKTRVEKFYLFFNPWFSLFKFKRGDTEYGIGWLPLGGYVKISGMIDESMDKEQLAQPAQPWEFRAKPAWQRLLIMVGGVLVNLVGAVLIFWMILFVWGESYIPAKEAKFGLQFHPVMHEIGLADGDQVLSVDQRPIESISDIAQNIFLEDAKSLQVKRGDSLLNIDIPADFNKVLLAKEVKMVATYQIPVVVDTVIASSNAHKGGLMKGDSIVSINDTPTPYFHQFTNEAKNNSNQTIRLGIYRHGEPNTLDILVSEAGTLGFGTKGPEKFMKVQTKEYSFFEAFPAGIKMGVNLLSNYIKQFKLVFSKEGVKQLGGFGAIGNLFPKAWDWTIFWYNTAFLSLMLAFMNILPIPALDGGHVLFLLYEMVSGRKPSEKFMEYAQITGMILLFTLLIYANGNDIFKAFFK